VERRRGGEDVTGDSVGGGWVGEVEAKMRSEGVYLAWSVCAWGKDRCEVCCAERDFGSTSFIHMAPWQGWD
jgi:hypothetical protein